MDGQKLKADGDSFRQKLNTQQLFEDWQAKVGMLGLGKQISDDSPTSLICVSKALCRGISGHGFGINVINELI